MFLKIVVKQARYKWGMSLLVLAAMIALVTLYVYLTNTTRFANRSMQLIMKRMGHNLLILPEEARPLDAYLCTDAQITFPDETTQRLSQRIELDSKYYVSVLQSQVNEAGRNWLLTGIEPVRRADETREKANLLRPLPRGDVRLGHAVWHTLKRTKEEHVSLLGRDFRVAETLPKKGSLDDYRIYMNLAECQDLLDKPGQINLILAFLCLHLGSLDTVLDHQRRQLAKDFPTLKQVARMDIAEGRYLARMTTQRSLHYLLGIVLTVTVLTIVISGLHEVGERKRELGIMISMGTGYLYIVGLYLGKMLVIALVASLAGFLLGSHLAVQLTTPFLVVNTQPVTILWQELVATVALACFVAAAAEMIPMIKLLRLDPNAILMEE